MNKYKLVLGVLFISVVTSDVAMSAFNEKDWQFYRDISIGGTGFTKLVLPLDISKNKKDFTDVRVITDSGIEVPHLITRNATIRNVEINGRILDKTVISGQEQFIVDLGEQGNVHTGLTLSSGLNNFRRQVSVYSSSSLIPIDDSRWSIVTPSGYIYRYTDTTSGYSSGKDFINFPANTSRYLKLVISSGDEGPIGVSSVRVYGDRKIDVPTYSENISANVSNNSTKKITEIIVDFGVSGKLTDAITLFTTDNNYSRRVIIESTDDISATSSWKYIGQGSISSISTSLFSGYSNRISYPEQNSRYLRFSVVNDDNRPLNIKNKVLVEGPVISLIFEARIGENYRLYYGNPSAVRSTYDIGAISTYIETNFLPASSIGTEKINPSFVAPEGLVVPISEKYPWLLNILLVFVVLIIGAGIGWYMYKYNKNIGTTDFH